jgi:hypothetical protein
MCLILVYDFKVLSKRYFNGLTLKTRTMFIIKKSEICIHVSGIATLRRDSLPTQEEEKEKEREHG